MDQNKLDTGRCQEERKELARNRNGNGEKEVYQLACNIGNEKDKCTRKTDFLADILCSVIFLTYIF